MKAMTQADFDSILTAHGSTAFGDSALYIAGRHAAETDVAMMPRNYVVSSDPLLAGSMCLLLVVAALLLYEVRRPYAYHLKGFFSNERTNYILPTDYKAQWVFISLMFVAFLAYALALVSFNHDALSFGFSPALGIPYWLLAVETAAIAALCYVKFGVYALVNWVFFTSEQNRNWMVSYLVMTALASLLLLAVSALAVFSDISPQVVTCCYVFSALLYEVVLVFKLFVNFQAKKYGILTILLYFCSVEVIPALVIWHYIDWATDAFIEAHVLY